MKNTIKNYEEDSAKLSTYIIITVVTLMIIVSICLTTLFIIYSI